MKMEWLVTWALKGGSVFPDVQKKSLSKQHIEYDIPINKRVCNTTDTCHHIQSIDRKQNNWAALLWSYLTICDMSWCTCSLPSTCTTTQFKKETHTTGGGGGFLHGMWSLPPSVPATQPLKKEQIPLYSMKYTVLSILQQRKTLQWPLSNLS